MQTRTEFYTTDNPSSHVQMMEEDGWSVRQVAVGVDTVGEVSYTVWCVVYEREA